MCESSAFFPQVAAHCYCLLSSRGVSYSTSYRGSNWEMGETIIAYDPLNLTSLFSKTRTAQISEVHLFFHGAGNRAWCLWVQIEPTTCWPWISLWELVMAVWEDVPNSLEHFRDEVNLKGHTSWVWLALCVTSDYTSTTIKYSENGWALMSSS